MRKGDISWAMFSLISALINQFKKKKKDIKILTLFFVLFFPFGAVSPEHPALSHSVALSLHNCAQLADRLLD